MTPQQLAAMQLALDLATMHHTDDGYAALRAKVRSASKEALAQPEQEPVAWPHKYGCRANAFGKCDMGCTTPPQRKPLTDEELEAMAENHVTNCYFDTLKFARAIEAAHNIKENT